MGRESNNIEDRKDQDQTDDADQRNERQEEEAQKPQHHLTPQQQASDRNDNEQGIRHGSIREVENGSTGGESSDRDCDHHHDHHEEAATRRSSPCLSPKEILELTQHSQQINNRGDTRQQECVPPPPLSRLPQSQSSPAISQSLQRSKQHDRQNSNGISDIGTGVVREEPESSSLVARLPNREEDYSTEAASRSIGKMPPAVVGVNNVDEVTSSASPSMNGRRLVSRRSGAFPIGGSSEATGNEEYDNLLEEGSEVSASSPDGIIGSERATLPQFPSPTPSPVPTTSLHGSVVSNDTLAFTIITEAVNVEPEEQEKRRLQERVREMEEQQRNTVEAVAVNAVSDNSDNNANEYPCCTSIENNGRYVQSSLVIILVLVAALVISVSLGITRPGDAGNDFASPPTSSPELEGVGEQGRLPPSLKSISERGYIRCGVVDVEFSLDLCRAIAAAIFGDPSKAEMSFIPFLEHWPSLANGTIDVTTEFTTPLMSRDIYGPTDDVQIPSTFSTPFLFSGTVFAGLPEFLDCADRGDTVFENCRDLVVCVNSGTTTSAFVAKHLDGSNIKESLSSDLLSTYQRFIDGDCNIVTGDFFVMQESYVRSLGYTGLYEISTIIHSKEPLTLMTRGDDPKFGDFVDSIIRALITAEAWNITKDTADMFPTTTIFGDEYGTMFVDAIAAVGNYGEMYNRSYGGIKHRSQVNTINRGDSGLLLSFPFGDTKIGASATGPNVNGTMDAISNASLLRCGLVGNRLGFAKYNVTVGEWTGMDVDFCRAVGAALLSHTSDNLVLVEFDTIEEGFLGLSNNHVDVLAGAQFSLENNVKEPTTGQGFDFGPIYYYGDDGQALALATRETDDQWSDFVRWITFATIYAEEWGINATSALDMPVVDLFGNQYRQAFRDTIIAVGNYGEMYEHHLEPYIPRSGRNMLSAGGTPQLLPLEGIPP